MTVRVVHGVNDDTLPLAGRTVAFAAENLRDVFNIPAEADALVDGATRPFDHVLHDGDCLEFVSRNGRKGMQEFWSEDELIQHLGDAEFERMKEAGLELTPRPVLTSCELAKWEKWLRDENVHPRDMIHVAVSIEKEWISVEGKQFPMKQNECAIVNCLLEAKGEPRSQNDIRARYSNYSFEERIDNTIRRSLKGHASGIGKFIYSDSKGFRLTFRKREHPLTK